MKIYFKNVVLLLSHDVIYFLGKKSINFFVQDKRERSYGGWNERTSDFYARVYGVMHTYGGVLLLLQFLKYA